jgi:hypothetical protein
MMTGIRSASNAKANREPAWNPAYPNWREGFRGINEHAAAIVFATLAVSKWIDRDRTGSAIKRVNIQAPGLGVAESNRGYVPASGVVLPGG